MNTLQITSEAFTVIYDWLSYIERLGLINYVEGIYIKEVCDINKYALGASNKELREIYLYLIRLDKICHHYNMSMADLIFFSLSHELGHLMGKEKEVSCDLNAIKLIKDYKKGTVPGLYRLMDDRIHYYAKTSRSKGE